MTSMQTSFDTNELSVRLNKLQGKIVFVSQIGCISCMTCFEEFEWNEEPETWMDIEFDIVRFGNVYDEQYIRIDKRNIRYVKDCSVLNETNLWIEFENGVILQVYSES